MQAESQARDRKADKLGREESRQELLVNHRDMQAGSESDHQPDNKPDLPWRYL